MAKLKNIHPGEVLLDEFLLPMNISQGGNSWLTRCSDARGQRGDPSR
ncbi:MAG TPA: hypothetical protein VJM53_07930 [Burkholderiales bacterium]|jgi:hypothetical protein|nr:hypothetical protein [Burkholderiales bacterium]